VRKLRILKSLLIIVALAAVAVGVTTALFTDEVKIAGNTLSTGTIKINVDGVRENHKPFTLKDMKPTYIEYSDFTVYNEGSNPANIIKKVTITLDDTKLAEVIDYSLSAAIYKPGDPNPYWFQTLYKVDNEVTMADINGKDMFLGMLPVGWSMNVKEDYRMKRSADNTYQGKTMTFDIAVIAEQLKGTVTFENKTGDPDWQLIGGDGISATMLYGVMDSMFNFTFVGRAKLPNTDYTLVIGDNPWVAGTALGSGLTDGVGDISFNGSVDLDTKTNQKVWLVPTADWDGSRVSVFDLPNFLFETGLIDYYKS
jgi:predicted ribosomally synthesized peptide with SipW-like signal peptide